MRLVIPVSSITITQRQFRDTILCGHATIRTLTDNGDRRHGIEGWLAQFFFFFPCNPSHRNQDATCAKCGVMA